MVMHATMGEIKLVVRMHHCAICLQRGILVTHRSPDPRAGGWVGGTANPTVEHRFDL
jgi:hypothetical protein